MGEWLGVGQTARTAGEWLCPAEGQARALPQIARAVAEEWTSNSFALLRLGKRTPSFSPAPPLAHPTPCQASRDLAVAHSLIPLHPCERWAAAHQHQVCAAAVLGAHSFDCDSCLLACSSAHTQVHSAAQGAHLRSDPAHARKCAVLHRVPTCNLTQRTPPLCLAAHPSRGWMATWACCAGTSTTTSSSCACCPLPWTCIGRGSSSSCSGSTRCTRSPQGRRGGQGSRAAAARAGFSSSSTRRGHRPSSTATRRCAVGSWSWLGAAHALLLTLYRPLGGTKRGATNATPAFSSAPSLTSAPPPCATLNFEIQTPPTPPGSFNDGAGARGAAPPPARLQRHHAPCVLLVPATLHCGPHHDLQRLCLPDDSAGAPAAAPGEHACLV